MNSAKAGPSVSSGMPGTESGTWKAFLFLSKIKLPKDRAYVKYLPIKSHA